MSFCPSCRSEYPDDWKRCPKDESSLLASRRIGKYEVASVLGTGGMGTVYRATNPDTRSPVAIKVMHPSASTDADSRARFRREAAAVAGLDTRHVVKVYDFGEEGPQESPYLVMELLRGHTLRREIRKPPGRMAMQRVDLALAGALRGLGAAHRAGVTHRDLKPENIYIADTDDGEVAKVLDFGIARVDRPGEKVLTQSGALMGTPAYMAPEQVAASRGDVGPWSDVYAVGVILYEMLIGDVPFAADSVTEVLSRVLERDFEPLADARPELPAAIHDLVGRALESDPSARFLDAGDMLRAWQEAYRELGPDVTGAPTPPFEPDAEPARGDQVSPHSETDVASIGHRGGSLGTGPTQAEPLTPTRPIRRSRLPLALVGLAAAAVAAAFALWPGQADEHKAPLADGGGQTPAVAADASAPPAVPEGMVRFDGGRFAMGMPAEQASRFPDADPRHQVEVAPFFLDQLEYTEAGSDLPLTGVTWNEARRRCRERGKRLPTEAEWEMAARSEELDPSGARLRGPDVDGPAPVGAHPGDCTREGVCDLLGNVMEWTGDPWRVRGGDDPEVDIHLRTVRGGSFRVAPEEPFYASPYARAGLAPDQRDPEVGFRCARDAAL